MSEKGRRSRAWDDAHLRGPLLWPVKATLRAFSSITLAVILLVLVVLYGVSASVPVGMLAMVPTLIVYVLTLLLAVGLLTVPPIVLARRVLRPGSVARFVAPFVLALVLAPVAAYLWYKLVWPPLHYDPKEGTGLRFFAGFIEQYRSTTIRRLPGVEMSELEYYSWWPLRVILMLFVVNMVVATVRRIEFTFKNIGVLTVHTGIVVIALGSVYYSGLKLEGDTVLLSGELDKRTGTPTLGPAQDIFYDNTDVALYVTQGIEWEQRLLKATPRYNDYNLGAYTGQSAWERTGRPLPWLRSAQRDLSLPVMPSKTGLIDKDISFRVVGYSHYANPLTDYMRYDTRRRTAVLMNQADNPLRLVYLHSLLPDERGVVSDDPVNAFVLMPKSPKDRLSIVRADDERPVFSVEYTTGPEGGMTEQRWNDLRTPDPQSGRHTLVIEVPQAEGQPPKRTVVTAFEGAVALHAGYTISVQKILPTPPFPIITQGFRDAETTTAELRITPPTGDPYTRYVYARFSQLDQDVFDTPQADGRPNRRAADASIRTALLESDHVAVYIDEPVPGPGGEPGPMRAIVRTPGGVVKVLDSILPEPAAEGLANETPGSPQHWLRNVVDKLSLRVGDRWQHAVKRNRPELVPEMERQKDDIGTHRKAMLAVEVSVPDAGDGAPWSEVVWLPFQQYMGLGMGGSEDVRLPDGRRVTVGFGRLQHPLPNFKLQLAKFEMLSYDHRGAPRDYQSRVRVVPVDQPGRRAGFDAYEHITQLNAPLMAPFHWSEQRSFVGNLFGRLASGLSPHQFKFSQAGWDQQGWQESQKQVDAGLLPEPFAKFTILGVGNNPGIHVIALGSILMGVGIPWAFYVKPWLVQREKKKLAAMAAARGQLNKKVVAS
jgi:hypothetical protein